MFQARHSSQDYKNLDSANCKDAWRRWSQKEEIIRLVAALHIHDAEIASILHHEPILRHAAVDLAKPAPDRIFNARNSQEWYAHINCCILASPDRRARLTDEGAPEAMRCAFTQATSFSAYADLERLLAAISEERHSDKLDQAVQSRLTGELVEFHQRNLVTLSADVDAFGLHILWHLCFMSLITDFDLFERAIGRDGKQMDAADRKSISSWAASRSARRAKVHMQQIQKRLEALPIGLEPTIHVPRAAFLVAISWYCAFCYMPSNQDRQPTSVEYPELRLLGLDSDVWSHGTGGFLLEINDVLCRLADLLQRLGHWEIARKFAAIIGELVIK
ncbi:hypothetical protein B0A55_12546 [Friedmanniomyces simplex]|uniref:Transcription factor domain-containing protein n=1 Tax=Friedmanniomyces simplex TaxID=329884 RepID=A0A4U0WDI6_9PEZI|nr:hypothetical protein B0A55_12546 [Friedmanniomyces simplex]